MTKKYKFLRWFAPRDHLKLESWSSLLGRNDLEFYDTENDPLELNNRVQGPEANKDLILKLKDRLNKRVEREIGADLMIYCQAFLQLVHPKFSGNVDRRHVRLRVRRDFLVWGCVSQ